jgi:hypothetical protein
MQSCSHAIEQPCQITKRCKSKKSAVTLFFYYFLPFFCTKYTLVILKNIAVQGIWDDVLMVVMPTAMPNGHAMQPGGEVAQW